MRTDPNPNGSEFSLLVEYLAYQRETVLFKTEGLTHAQLVSKHPPSELTVAGLLDAGGELDGGAIQRAA
jgi:hypothetical protein